MRAAKATVAILAASLLFAGCASPSGESSSATSATPEASNSEAASASAEPTSTTSANPKVTNAPNAPVVETGISTTDATAAQLVYLIEEEKLANDVYQAMFDLWGARVFGNILKSEQSHQSQVLAVMKTRGINDPRSSTAGVFENAELQALYNELIAKGSKSAIDAYEVGVAIEVLDIDDLTKMLATAKDADVIAMMENLRKGSENHLRAFNNQL
jgi:hypothetical protein